MNKIPVGRTIAHAYSFASGNFLRIIGVMWLPFAIIMVGAALLGAASGDFVKGIVSHDAGALGRAWFLLLPFYIFTFFFFSMQIVGITQLALGHRQEPAYFYFSLEKPVWRLTAAFLIFLLLIFAAVFVIVVVALLIGIIVAAVTGVAPGAKPSVGASATLGLGAIVAVVVLYLAFVYAVFRQMFLLAPVVVVEDRIGLSRAWNLGRGNFWRMFAVTLGTVLPIALLIAAFFFCLFAVGFPHMPALGASAAQIEQWNEQELDWLRRDWFVVVPAYFLFLAAFYGLFTGAQAFAYRALVSPEHTP